MLSLLIFGNPINKDIFHTLPLGFFMICRIISGKLPTSIYYRSLNNGRRIAHVSEIFFYRKLSERGFAAGQVDGYCM